MQITAIRAEVVHASVYSNYVFVIAETDEGVMGFGDATLDGLEFEVVAAVKNLGSKLIGKNVLDDDCSISGDGGGLITAAAASGIDIAMWDLKGKALNVPIYKLLGGAKRKAIPVYASFNRAIRDRTPEGFGAFAKELVQQGNKALKCHPFDGVSWRTPLEDQKKLVDLGCQRFIAMREAVGDDGMQFPLQPVHHDLRQVLAVHLVGPVVADLGQRLVRVRDHRRALIRPHRGNLLAHIRDLPGIGHHHLLGLVRSQVVELRQHLLCCPEIQGRLIVRILKSLASHDDSAVYLVLGIQEMHVAGGADRPSEMLPQVHDAAVDLL